MDEIKAGRAAQRLLGDETFQRAVEEADARFVQEWRGAETVEERERAHAKQAALGQVIQELRTVVGSGELAEARSEDQ